MDATPSQNFGLELLRTAEAAAMAGGRWMGLGQKKEADAASTDAMYNEFRKLDIAGTFVGG